MDYIKIIAYVCKLNPKRFFGEAFYYFLEYMEYILLGCLYLKWIVNEIQNGSDLRDIIIWISFFTVILFAMYAIRSYVANVIRPITSVDIYQKVYREIYKKASEVELDCFENEKFYRKYMLVLEHSDEKLLDTIKNLFDVIFGFMTVVVTFVLMYKMDKLLIVFVFVPLVSNFTFGVLYNKTVFKREKDIINQKRYIEYSDRIMRLKKYANDLRTTNLFNIISKNYSDSVSNIKKITKNRFPKAFFLNYINSIFSFSVFSFLFLYASYRTIVSKTMSMADLAVILTIAAISSFVIIRITYSFSNTIKSFLYATTFMDFLKYKPKISELQDGIYPDEIINEIEFKNVCFSYNDEEVLHDVSFKIEGNCKVGLVGKNGEGKTTLVKLLLRLYDPTSGQILVNGIDIKKYNLKEYRKRFSSVLQDYQLFAMSIKDNISISSGQEFKQDSDQLKAVLENVFMRKVVEALPDREDTIITREFDEKGTDFSGGQKQKIAIARTFASNARIKIYDEPTSALDPIAEQRMLQNICTQENSGIIFLITHRLSLLNNFEKILVINNGCIVECDTHDNLMKRNSFYKDMYMKQAKKYIDNCEAV